MCYLKWLRSIFLCRREEGVIGVARQEERWKEGSRILRGKEGEVARAE